MGLKNMEAFKNFIDMLKNKIHKVDESEKIENMKLIENINIARDEWILAQKNFQFVDTVDGVDYYAYKIKAYEAKYQALLKEAKERGVQIIDNDKKFF